MIYFLTSNLLNIYALKKHKERGDDVTYINNMRKIDDVFEYFIIK